MEESGLRPTDLSTLVSYSIAVIPPSGDSKTDKRLLRILVWIALLVVLPVHLAAPVLTGSITWYPSTPPAEPIFRDGIFSDPVYDHSLWNDYASNPEFPTNLQIMIESASYRPLMTWGQDISNDALKRFVASFTKLDVNSTLSSITLPYFSIESIEPIDDSAGH